MVAQPACKIGVQEWVVRILLWSLPFMESEGGLQTYMAKVVLYLVESFLHFSPSLVSALENLTSHGALCRVRVYREP